MPPDPTPIANPRPETYRYPGPVRHLGLDPQPSMPPPTAISTEVDATRNWPAGIPLEIEP